MNQCQHCAFFVPHEARVGFCHSEPPKVFMFMLQQTQLSAPQPVPFSTWPTVSPDSGCGKFDPKIQLS